MKVSLGQNVDIWTNAWKKSSVESEIQMWDYFGTRPWVAKFTPRHGKVLEAGCGLGRVNFFLSNFGIDITGLDFSEDTIALLNEWQQKNNYNIPFHSGDVKALEYEDNSLSGYLSFGVIEHFIEGPQQPLAEAYRVLRPGGIAIISTPNKSWFIRYGNIKKSFRNFIKKLLKIKNTKTPFFQYEYSPKTLRKFVNESGLFVTVNRGTDHLYCFTQYGNYQCKNIFKGSFAQKASHILDNSFLHRYGAQSITISVKIADKMHCFLCNDLSATKECLNTYSVPICSKCQEHELAKFYLLKAKTYFHHKYIFNKKYVNKENRTCDFCNKDYITDRIFEEFGFSKNVCKICLKNKDINIKLSNTSLQAIWRKGK